MGFGAEILNPESRSNMADPEFIGIPKFSEISGSGFPEVLFKKKKKKYPLYTNHQSCIAHVNEVIQYTRSQLIFIHICNINCNSGRNLINKKKNEP